MEAKELAKRIAEKLKNYFDIFIITYTDNYNYIQINNEEFQYTSILIILPTTNVYIRITKDTKISDALLSGITSIVLLYINHPYLKHLSYLDKPLMIIHDKHVYLDNQYIADIDYLIKNTDPLYDSIMKTRDTNVAPEIIKINNNYFIVKNECCNILNQIIDSITTNKHLYKLTYCTKNHITLYHLNTSTDFCIYNINKTKDILRLYSKAYKPFSTFNTTLSITIYTCSVKITVTNEWDSNELVFVAGIEELDKFGRIIEKFFNIVNEFDKLLIRHFGHVINFNTYMYFESWINNNIADILKSDDDIDYWFNKMVVDLV